MRENTLYKIANSDPLTHDVRIFNDATMLNRFEMESLTQPIEQNSNGFGIYVIRCGLHKWMHAFVVSAKHPFYAVTNERGEFKMEHVPEGSYPVHIWHEALGEGELLVDLKQSMSDFTYTFKNQS